MPDDVRFQGSTDEKYRSAGAPKKATPIRTMLRNMISRAFSVQSNLGQTGKGK